VSFSPATTSTSGTTSTMSITAASSAVPGTYNMTVTGTNGTLVQSTPLTLIIN
jgi:hypothetical protein